MFRYLEEINEMSIERFSKLLAAIERAAARETLSKVLKLLSVAKEKQLSIDSIYRAIEHWKNDIDSDLDQDLLELDSIYQMLEDLIAKEKSS